MSDELRNALPGLFSIAVLVLAIIAQATSSVPFTLVDLLIDVLLAVSGWLGIPWTRPRLPWQQP